MIEHVTAPGTVETPFMYVYDASTLTDGASYSDLTVVLDGDADFLLRRVAGLSFVAESIWLSDGRGLPVSSKALRAGRAMVLTPEVAYRRDSVIRFRLNNVLRSFNACATNIYYSLLAFQGVKVRAGTPVPGNPGARIPYEYSEEVAVNWYRYTAPPVVEPPRTFRIAVDNYDFFLEQIRITSTTGLTAANTPLLLTLFDGDDRPLSSAPLPHQYINSNRQSTLIPYGNCWPVPEVRYRKGSTIRFDVTSMICNTDPSFPVNLRIEFTGYRSMP